MKLKKIFLTTIIFLVTKNYSQITTTTIEVRNKVKEQKKYDGKSNFEEFGELDDYKQYIGQKIYTIKYYNYSSIYFSTGENCEDCINKYFTIKDVTQKELRLSEDSKMQVCSVFELINNENGETYYYKLGKSSSGGAGWTSDGLQPSIILVPYFINQKKTFENKKYVIVSYWRKDGFINEATKEWVSIDKNLYGGEWNCEVSLVKGDFFEELTYIMRSNIGETISANSVHGSSNGKFKIIKKLGDLVEAGLFFMSIDDYNDRVASNNKAKKDTVANNSNRIDKLAQKYGKGKAVLIVKGKVEIGMTKEMCKESWGIPLKIYVEKTKEITKETFIYSLSRMLHFENGKLVKIEY